MDSKGVLWVVIVYVILTLSQGYDFQGCYGAYLGNLSCEPVNTVVSIVNGTYGLSTCGNECCPDLDNDCHLPMPEDHLQDLRDGCDGKNQCTDFGRVDRINTTECAPVNYTDYAVIRYDCLTNNGTVTSAVPGKKFQKCYGVPYSRLSCDWNTNISIISGHYGLSTCLDHCCPDSDNDCLLPMPEDQLQDLRDKCDGKFQCSNVGIVDRIKANCANYVVIQYQCLTDDGTVTGMVVGIVVACVLVLLLVSIIVLAIYVKRRQPSWANNLPKFNLPTFNMELFKKGNSTTHSKRGRVGTSSQVTSDTTQCQGGTINHGFTQDSTASVASNGCMNERAEPYAGAHIVRTPKEAVDTMRFIDTNPKYENVQDEIIQEPCGSTEDYNDRCLYPESMIAGHTYCSIPSEVNPDIPDLVPQISEGHEPRKISGVERVVINDDIYYCPLDNTKPSTTRTDDEDIYDTNE